MKRLFVISLVVIQLNLVSLPRASAQVSPPKEFITSVTYGVLAGTLMGIASLAFTRNPGDNLNKIARGASLGLYLGIALGLYVTYGVGDEPPPDDLGYRRPIKEPDFIVYPIISENASIEGVAGMYKAFSF